MSVWFCTRSLSGALGSLGRRGGSASFRFVSLFSLVLGGQLAKEGGKRDGSKMAAILGLTDFDNERDEGATLQ